MRIFSQSFRIGRELYKDFILTYIIEIQVKPKEGIDNS